MADVRQSIVLGVEIDQLSPGSADSFECCVQPVCVPSDGESLFFEEVADDIVGSVFLVCEFGMGPNLTLSVIAPCYVSAHEYLAIQLSQGRMQGADAFVDSSFDFSDRRHIDNSPMEWSGRQQAGALASISAICATRLPTQITNGISRRNQRIRAVPTHKITIVSALIRCGGPNYASVGQHSVPVIHNIQNKQDKLIMLDDYTRIPQ